jgi:hypothetical protein
MALAGAAGGRATGVVIAGAERTADPGMEKA